MQAHEKSRFTELYQKHLRALKLKGLAPNTIDSDAVSPSASTAAPSMSPRRNATTISTYSSKPIPGDL